MHNLKHLLLFSPLLFKLNIRFYILTIKKLKVKNISFNILKYALDNYLKVSIKIINSSIEQNKFPNQLQLAHIITISRNEAILI